MEDKVKNLLEKHKQDMDLTSEKDYIESGWDWSGAYLSNWNLSGLKLSTADKIANFERAILSSADLKETDLTGANLQKAIIAYADIRDAVLIRANLRECLIEHANLQRADLSRANLTKANLNNSNLIQTRFDGALLLDTSIYNAKIDGSTIKYAYLDPVLLQERTKEYEEANEIYRMLKFYFLSVGDYSSAGRYLYREKLMQKYLYRQRKKYLRYCISHLLDLLSGYGERPFRFLISFPIIIIIFAIIYYFTNGIMYQCSSYHKPSFWECSYFSIVTFTTLGYGDFIPKSCCQTISSIQALLGAVFFALFASLLGRRFIR